MNHSANADDSTLSTLLLANLLPEVMENREAGDGRGAHSASTVIDTIPLPG